MACLALGAGLVSAQDADPPGRVARLNLLQGQVSQLPAGDNDWSPAEINRPLTTGDRLRTHPGARLELHSGSTAVRLDGAAALDIGQLDDNTTRLTLSEGTMNLRVRNLYPGEQVEIDTPNLALTVQQPGSYRLEVDPRFGTTRVAARSGAATLYGENAESLALVANGQVMAFAGRNLSQSGLAAPLQADGFDQWADARDRAEDQSISARYVSREIPGYQQLDSFGGWQNDATYGAVWLPRIAVAEWAPYRYGQWRWIAPWGWTWVDDAPWGFAPFHYGRWTQIGPRWAWVPGPRVPRPTYAPALVGFLGGQPGRGDWNVHAGPDRRPGPGIGWFPLAPGEAWRPGYRASPSYLGGVNRDRDIHRPHDGRGEDRGRPYFFQGRPNAVTAVPQADFGRGPAWRANQPGLRGGDLAGAQLLTAPPMPAMRPGNRRPDTQRDGVDHPEWKNAARNQAEQNQRAQIQAEEARQRQQEALQRPSLERQAQQDRLGQDAQRRQIEEQQRQQRWQQQQQQRNQQPNQIDPPGVRPQLLQQQAMQQQAEQQRREQRLQQERQQHEREQAERGQREQLQRQQFQQQREQQNQVEQQRSRQQAQQAQQAEQMRREQQAQQERLQQQQRQPGNPVVDRLRQQSQQPQQAHPVQSEPQAQPMPRQNLRMLPGGRDPS